MKGGVVFGTCQGVEPDVLRVISIPATGSAPSEPRTYHEDIGTSTSGIRSEPVVT